MGSEMCIRDSAKDLQTVASLHETVMRISSTIYSVGHYGSSVIKGIKCSLALMGICDDFLAEPFHRFRDVERDAIRKHLTDLGVLD